MGWDASEGAKDWLQQGGWGKTQPSLRGHKAGDFSCDQRGCMEFE